MFLLLVSTLSAEDHQQFGVLLTKYNQAGHVDYAGFKIFKWFSEDFNEDIIGFFQKHASGKLKSDINTRKSSLKIKYLDYDWSLNGS